MVIRAADGSGVSDTIPAGPTLTAAVGDVVAAGAALTNDPNVGGFGQLDAEVVLQNPNRIYGLLAFFAAIALAQILLVLKKRQVEKVQAAVGIGCPSFGSSHQVLGWCIWALFRCVCTACGSGWPGCWACCPPHAWANSASSIPP